MPRFRKKDIDTNRFASESGPRRTLRTIGLVLAVAVSALPALFYADPITYVPPIVFVLSLLGSYVALRRVAKRLRVDETTMAGSCERGESVLLEVVLDNPTHIPITRIDLVFMISDEVGNLDVARSARAAVGSKQELPLCFDATFAHLGRYRCGVNSVVLYDYFGLFSRRIEVKYHEPILVRPRQFDVGNPDLAHVTQQEASKMFKPIAADDADYASVREYRPGDPMKTVHWNLSSRDPQGRLYTRLYEAYSEPGLSIILDPNAPRYNVEELRGVFDALVESAASISECARHQGVDTSVHYVRSDGGKASVQLGGTSDVEALVGSMRHIQAAGDGAGDEAMEMLEAEAKSNAGKSNVAYCTSRVSNELVSLLISMKMRRRNPLLFVAVPRTIEDEEKRKIVASLHLLSAAGIPYYLVDSNEVATEVKAA